MLRTLLITTALAALVLHSSFARSSNPGADSSNTVGVPGDSTVPIVDVTGEVKLVEQRSPRTHWAKDASRVVVWLVPLGATADAFAPPLSARRHYRMLQHNKMFEPELLVVPLGSIVDFPNLDPWFHNVFSLYQGKRFDLGLYQAGSEKAVNAPSSRPGPSFLFCNIHPQMTAVILAVNSDLFGISDKTGRLLIPRVPPGRYRVHVWYENAAPDFTDATATRS